jgi:putative flippase GtrA
MKRLSGSINRLPQKLRYVAIGTLNTVVGYGFFGACYVTLKQQWPYLAILALSHLMAVSFSFATHGCWVFPQSGGRTWRQVAQAWLRFQTSYIGLLALGLAVNTGMLAAVTSSPWLAQGVATLVGVAAGYGLHKYFVFRNHE